MERVRIKRWSDDRLDDLGSRVDGLSRRVEAEFRHLAERMDGRFDNQEARTEAHLKEHEEKLEARYSKQGRKIDELRAGMTKGFADQARQINAMLGSVLVAIIGTLISNHFA